MVLLGATMPFAVAKTAHRDGVTPVVFGMPSVVAANEKLQIEVDLSGVAPVDQVVEISTSCPANWSYLPSEVVVPAGQSQIVFAAATSSNPHGTADACASCNGGSVGNSAVVVGIG